MVVYSVYKIYETQGELIYVGFTGRGISRIREHNKDKEWFGLIANIETEHFPTRGEALEREAVLIRELKPRYNVALNSDRHISRRIVASSAPILPIVVREPPAGVPYVRVVLNENGIEPREIVSVPHGEHVTRRSGWQRGWQRLLSPPIEVEE